MGYTVGEEGMCALKFNLKIKLKIIFFKECPENQYWANCGSACPGTCENPIQICTKQCVVGCRCNPEFLLNSENICIPMEECK